MHTKTHLKTFLAAMLAAAAGAAGADAAKQETVAGPGRDYFNDQAFRKEYRDAAVAIARKKMVSDEIKRQRSGVKTPFKVRERISTGGGFSGFFVWDAVFGVLWGRYVDGMPVHGTLDNFYALQQDDGFICREYDGSGRPMWRPNHPGAYNPPILAWAEIELYRSGKSDKARLETVYPKLVKFHDCYERNLKRADGLYFSDILGCGMDDLKRWPRGMPKDDLKKGGIEFTKDNLYPWSEKFWDRWMSKIVPQHTWNRQAAWIDMSAQMAFDCLNLADIASATGKDAEAAKWMKEYARIKDLVNEKCWDEKTGFYYDYCDTGLIMRKHAGAFWVLLAKIPTPERAKRMAAVMTDPRFFGRTIPVPALSADDPDYKPLKGYWQGPVWPPTAYVAICGLRACGQTAAARRIAHGWYNGNAEYFVRFKTVFENIMPDYEYIGRRRRHSGRDFCGWGALAPVAIPAEWEISR